MPIDVSNIINVSLTQLPSSVTEQNVNNVALHTIESPIGWSIGEKYRVYVNARSVATDFGTNSITYKQANALFSQSPNILTGNGSFIVIPFNGVSATSGQFTTANISANLADIIATNSGDIKITLNGTVFNLTNLDFTACTTFNDVASVIQARLTNAIVTANGVTGFVIKSKKVGASSTVAMAAVSGGTGTDLSVSGYFNAVSGAKVDGVNASGETLIDSIEATETLIQYTGALTNLDMESTAIESVASAIQSRNMIFLYSITDTNDIAGIATTIKEASLFKTRILFYSSDVASGRLFVAAYVGRGFSVDLSGSNTSITMNLKTLTTISPDPIFNTTLSQTLYTQLQAAGVDFYSQYGAYSCTFSTGANNYFDNVYAQIAIKFALEAAGFNYLATTTTKIPQTEEGMDGLKGAYRNVLERFKTTGYIAAGLSWNSSETFGNPVILKQNVTDIGYYVYSQPIASQSQIDRTNRIAPVVQMAIKFGGAIQKSDVIGIIEA
jgi:hypothetical protein